MMGKTGTFSGGAFGRFVTALSAAALILCLWGCTRTEKVVTGCETDSDCGDEKLFSCQKATGTCLCRTDDACGKDMKCNKAGYCQASSGCFESDECPDGFFCDPKSNICLPKGRCASDLHCPQGEICDAATFTCREGCRSHGDCLFGAACRCGDGDCTCESLDETERMNCAVGVCDASRCISSDYCGFGERCQTSGDGKSASCESDYDVVKRPFCDACAAGVAGSLSCGDGPNFCLYSNYTRTTFCGADCSAGQGCPNGFTCNDVIVVWMRTQCTESADCKRPENLSAVPCTTGADCPNSALCDVESGFCYGACIRSEGSSGSFCACVEDDDCAQDECDPVTRTCRTSRQSCDPAVTGSCPTIRCVDFGNRGGCLIGKNCAPEEGLTCEDMDIVR